MHVLGIKLDLNTLLQIVFTVLVLAFGFLHLIKNTASKYFEVNANFHESSTTSKPIKASAIAASATMSIHHSCFVCGKQGSKQCSRCKSVHYCSQECQTRDWSSGHKNKCKKFNLSEKLSSKSLTGGAKASVGGSNSAGTANGGSKVITQTKKILYPYEEFMELFNWDISFPPCGLINCGNSCFANVVLQCLSFTRPLSAYLLEKGHRRECRRNDWCFLCELQVHVERAIHTLQPFSPINILSRLTNIGGNLGYGRQEDAHELMRFAIDTMQSVCLDEFGGERAVHPSSQETTLIQHIFGGQLQSQVICTECEKVSNQYENMMDLTVEINGDASSLEECLNQFTAKEWLHGENMYKCDGCNDYVKAGKRLAIQTPPNILTIALKRFQSGRFGKLNKKVSFPETLDLSPYMSEAGDGTDVYKLYAVVVHLDMLNASFFGHYICYVKDLHGTWYKIDDCKVKVVRLDEVLSQVAYMLLYSRMTARPSCLKAAEHLEDAQKEKEKIEPCLRKQNDSFAPDPTCDSESLSSDSIPYVKLSSSEREPSSADYSGSTEELGHTYEITSASNSSLADSQSQQSSGHENDSSPVSSSEVPAEMNEDTPMSSSPILKEIPIQEEESYIVNTVGDAKTPRETVVDSESLAPLSGASCSDEEPEAVGEKSLDADLLMSKSSTAAVNDLKFYGNGHANMEHDGFPVKEAHTIFSNSFHSSDETSAKVNNLKHDLPYTNNVEGGNAVQGTK